MNFGEIIRTALVEIRGHKLRSALTLLGIVLGTLSITVMTSFLTGVVNTVSDGITQLGYDGVMYVVEREPRNLRDTALFTRSKGLQPADGDVLLQRAERLTAVAPVAFYEDLARQGDIERKVRVMGVTPSYAGVRKRTLTAGRFVNDADERSFARVCVLGPRLRNRLFGGSDPINKTISLGGRRFQVVGVTADFSNMFVHDDGMAEEMEGLYVPLATLRKVYLGGDQPLSFLAVKTDDVDNLGKLKSEVLAGLKVAHRGAEDFRVENIAEEIFRARKGIKEELFNWKVVLGSIAGISLLVGGIGLMSVMLISIGERLYEIGLRKAMGATDLQVFLQFLLESMVLSLIGGLLGVAAGAGITKACEGFFKSGLPINIGGLALGIGIALALGALYGAYPAFKASRLSPVDALRSAA